MLGLIIKDLGFIEVFSWSFAHRFFNVRQRSVFML